MLNKLIAVRRADNQRGSYSLEMVMAISAVAVVTAGIFTFYGNIRDFFQGYDLGQVTTCPEGSNC